MSRFPKQEIIDQLLADLAVDRYLTDDQCFRRYELGAHAIRTLTSAKVIRRTHMPLRATQWSRTTIPATIISAGHLRKDPLYVNGMEHFLGLAEVRWLLRDRVTHWQRIMARKAAPHYFDVVAFDDQGELLIEYDTGHYAAERVVQKAAVARTLGRRQMWATPSHKKVSKLLNLVPDAEVWLVRWDDGSTRLARAAQMQADVSIASSSTGDGAPRDASGS